MCFPNGEKHSRDMAEELLFIVLIAGGAAAVPFVSNKLRLPSSIVEIAYGIALFNLAIHHRPEWFAFFKELGLIYLMFIAGMELDLRKLLGQGRFYLYTVAAVLPFMTMPFAFMYFGQPFYLGIVVSVISAGVIIPVLKELRIIRLPLGREIVSMTLTGELVSIVVLTGLDIYKHHGLNIGALWATMRVVVLFTAAALFLRLMHLIAWWNPERVERVMEIEDPVEEGVRVVIFIVLTGALCAYYAGVEPILGSFITGVIFSDVFREKERFEEKLNAVGFGFFIPLFFIGVGGDFDIGLLSSTSDIILALLLSVTVLLSNLPLMLASGLAGMRTREAGGAALILSSPLSMMIVAATLGLKTGLLQQEYFGPIVLASMISTVLYPSIFRVMSGSLTNHPPPERNGGL